LQTGVLLNLTPGQDTLYILGRSIAQGRRIGLASALGNHRRIGRPHPRRGARIVGRARDVGLRISRPESRRAVYLVYLGVRILITRTAAFGATDVADSIDTWTAFRQGMLTNVLNPRWPCSFLR